MSNPISSVISSMMKQETYGKESEDIIDKSKYSSVELLQKRHSLYARQLQWYKRSVLPEAFLTYQKARFLNKYSNNTHKDPDMRKHLKVVYESLFSRYFSELKQYKTKNDFNFQNGLLYAFAVKEYNKRLKEFYEMRETFNTIKNQIKQIKEENKKPKIKVPDKFSEVNWYTTPVKLDGKKRIFVVYSPLEDVYFCKETFCNKRDIKNMTSTHKLVAWTDTLKMPENIEKYKENLIFEDLKND